MTDLASSSGGLTTRPADSLLIARARDYLAAGPADPAELVRRVCQLPAIGVDAASRIASELLGGHPEFARDEDGRWRLASRPTAHAEAGAPVASAPTRVPTFDEWRAARASAGVGAVRSTDAPSFGGRVEAAADAPPRERRARPRPILPGDDDRLAELSYVVVDVETTGGTPDGGHRVTEVAAVVVEGGKVQRVFETLVNPQRAIPPQIMRLTGISWEMVRDKAPFAAVADALLDVLGGRVFVAHNAAFDWRFLSAEFSRANGRVLDGRRLCTVRMSRKLLPQLRSRSLGYVAEWYGATKFAETYFESHHGRERPWRHSAAGDAVATAHCLLRLLDDAADRGITTWGAMDRWLAGGTGAARVRRKSAMPSGMRRDADG